MFITFEGGEGSGKSTQLTLLHESLEKAGVSCMKTREPGGSDGAERIRRLLVEGRADAWNAEAETLLFYAARLDHVNRLVKPALAAGKTVLCDRFADSTLVYQGIGKGLSEEYIRSLHHLTLGNFAPDLTIILDIDPAIGLKRALERRGGETRFEALGLEFHQRIRAGFLSIAQAEPGRCVVANAAGKIEKIHEHIVDAIHTRLGLMIC
ncbi:MAG: dTMP kinase [Pseudomonadota bacterium]|nr:dTMP kinase [Pseudomonadota bacterium]MDE3037915.1 dTMP kinase [Pseudomonadota bacterium]